jgi:hypothetical protein
MKKEQLPTRREQFHLVQHPLLERKVICKEDRLLKNSNPFITRADGAKFITPKNKVLGFQGQSSLTRSGRCGKNCY